MDPRVLSSWQIHHQDAQRSIETAPSHYQRAPDSVYYHTVPIGVSLAEIVAMNETNPSFAQGFRVIDSLQHILISGRFQEYLTYTDASIIETVFNKFLGEAVAFFHDQGRALHGDRDCLEAYDIEVRNFELMLKLRAVEAAAANPTISTTEELLATQKAQHLANSVLLMMRSRSASLEQDFEIRKVLLQIEHAINRISVSAMQFLFDVKLNLINHIHNETVLKGRSWKILNQLLPLDDMRKQKREELWQCRHLRVVLDRKLGEAKARLEASEPAFTRVKMKDTEDVVKNKEIKKEAPFRTEKVWDHPASTVL